MIIIQEKRRLAKNPHLVTGTFRPRTGTKSLYQKIQDLLKDYYYPKNEFKSLKLDVILAEKQLDEAQEELQKAERVIAGMKEKENQAITITNELTMQVDLLEKEILDSQMPEYEKTLRFKRRLQESELQATGGPKGTTKSRKRNSGPEERKRRNHSPDERNKRRSRASEKSIPRGNNAGTCKPLCFRRRLQETELREMAITGRTTRSQRQNGANGNRI